MYGSSGKFLLASVEVTINFFLVLHRAYNVVFGLFQAPYYAFSQTMMAELTPPGFDNMASN